MAHHDDMRHFQLGDREFQRGRNTVAAAAFAGVLVALIRSDEVRELLAGVLRGAFGG